MAVETFTQELLKMAVAQLHVANLQAAAKDMFGRGYFALSPAEAKAVDTTVWPLAQGMAQWINPETLTGAPSTQQPAGFVQPSGRPEDKP